MALRVAGHIWSDWAAFKQTHNLLVCSTAVVDGMRNSYWTQDEGELTGSQLFQILRHTARILEHAFVIPIDSQGDILGETAAAVAATEAHKCGFAFVSEDAFDARTEHNIAALSQSPRISQGS